MCHDPTCLRPDTNRCARIIPFVERLVKRPGRISAAARIYEFLTRYRAESEVAGRRVTSTVTTGATVVDDNSKPIKRQPMVVVCPPRACSEMTDDEIDEVVEQLYTVIMRR